MGNSEGPDGIPHKVAFHQDLLLFSKTKSIFRERNIILEIITCNPSIYTMDHPDLFVETLW